MRTEELMELGLSREQAGKVLAINGRDIERLKSANSKEVDTLKKDLTASKETLKKWEEADIDGLKEEAEKWKQQAMEAELKEKKSKEEMLIQKESKGIYQAYRAKDAALLDKLIDWGKVSVKKGAVCGLDEQVQALKESYGFLFESKKPIPYFSAASTGFAESKDTDEIRKAMGISV